MNFHLSLIPRLNYVYTIKDIIISWRGIFRSSPNKYIKDNFPFKGETFFVNHARTGLRLILSSLELEKGSNIGVQVFTCPTVFKAIEEAEMKPLFIEINKDFNLDLDDLRRKSDKIKALIVTHTFGIPVDINEIEKNIPSIPIIEDCAHSFLSEFNGIPVGNIGIASMFSIGKGKFPSIGAGGFIVINNKKISSLVKANFDKLQEPCIFLEFLEPIRYYLLSLLHNRFVYKILTKKAKRFLHNRESFSYQKTFFESKMLRCNLALFDHKLKHINNYLKIQTENKKEILKSLNLQLPNKVKNGNAFMLALLIENSNVISNAIQKEGFELGHHFSLSIESARKYNYKKGDCKVTEDICAQILTIPCHYNYEKKNILKLSEKLKKFISYDNFISY